MASRLRVLLIGLAAAGALRSAAAQTPFEEFNFRAKVLADYDRDQDGELSVQELRNAVLRAEVKRASVLEDLARGALRTEPWMSREPSIWDIEANARMVANYAGRWQSAQESLPAIGLDGLPADPSFVRDLTPWEFFHGDELFDPLARLTAPAVMRSPFATPWWLKTATAAPTTQTAATTAGATPGTPQPSAAPGPLARANPSTTPGGLSLPSLPNAAAAVPINGTVYRADATLAAKANAKAGVPQFQFGTTKVIALEPPKPPAASTNPLAAPQRAERPKATPKAGALGPTRVVPPSPNRAGVLTTRPAGSGARP